MTRQRALEAASGHFRSGDFVAELDRRVGFRTESQDPGKAAVLRAYLEEEMRPALDRLGFASRVASPPGGGGEIFLVARRHEGDALPTVLMYGHGDVVAGMEGRWRDGIDPWRVTVSGDRLYGRGTADNKGQHGINLAALAEVLRVREGRLGFNAALILEMGEETGSPGLRAMCEAAREELAADLLVASDGPRLSADQPTVFLGSRGGLRIHLDLALREGAHHSGNWGGLLANPATILASAIAGMVDARGRILVERLRPPPIPDDVRAALSAVALRPGADEPAISEGWGEPGLSDAERLYGWNTLEVLALHAGDTRAPVNAIPGAAEAVLQLRTVVGTDADGVADAVRAHLDAHGFGAVGVRVSNRFNATRTDLGNPWVGWAAESIRRTTGRAPALLPNFGGSLPNDVFAEVLGLPTLWIPHSYPGCCQHAPDEHLPGPLAEEALRIMAGLFWDLGEPGRPAVARAGAAS